MLAIVTVLVLFVEAVVTTEVIEPSVPYSAVAGGLTSVRLPPIGPIWSRLSRRWNGHRGIWNVPVLCTAGDPILAEVSYSVSPSNMKKSKFFAGTWLGHKAGSAHHSHR